MARSMSQFIKTIRRYIWLLRALFDRHRKMIVYGFLGGVVVCLLVIQLTPIVASQIKQERRIIGLVGIYTPTPLPIAIQRLVSSGLTDVDAQGVVTGALAQSWDIDSTHKIYTFHLRNDVLWHDGKKFTAADINYNLRDVVISAENDTTLKITLKEPFAPLPSFLSKPLFQKGLVGLGSYKITAHRLKGGSLAYLKLESFTPDLPIVEIKFYASETAAKTAFNLGEVNVLDEMNSASEFTGWKNISIKENKKLNQYVAIFLNTKDKLLEKKEIRQALAFALDKPEKNRIATPISSQSWAYTNRIKQYDKDLDQAKKFLKDLPSGTTITLSTFQQYLPLAQIVAASWKAAGVETKIKIENSTPDEFQALLATSEIPSDPDQYTMWHSTQKDTNITHYANPKVDKLLEESRKEIDIEQRKKIYLDFQRYLVEDAPAIFLFHPSTYTISRK